MAKADAATTDEIPADVYDDKPIKGWLQMIEAANQEAQQIQNESVEDERDMTEEEQEKVDKLLANVTRWQKSVDQRRELNANEARLQQRAGRRTQPEVPANSGEGAPRIPATVASNRENHGFRSFGEYARAVAKASHKETPHSEWDFRLRNAPTTVATEGVGADGGFAVPPDFRDGIIKKIMAEDSLLARTDQQTSSSNGFTVPLDEVAPWDTTNGIQFAWLSEGGLLAQSKPKLKEHTVKLHKGGVLVPVTEELLEDAPSLTAYLNTKAPEKIDFGISQAILNGNGVGQPLGILNSPDLITVDEEDGQEAATIVAANVNNMWSRCYAPWRANAVWLANQDVEPQLQKMFLPFTTIAGDENVGGQALYTPPGGLSAAPYATLKGRPVIYHQACQTLGAKGDLVLACLPQYITVTKTGGGIKQSVSMHLWFDYDVMAFKFTIRIGGQSWWSQVIQPKHGSTTYGAFVVMEERAGS